MNDHSPHSRSSRQQTTKRAPGWIAPVLAAVIAAGATWGIGTTFFKGPLVEAGQPEELSTANEAQKAQWQLGTQFANLSKQATSLQKQATTETETAALKELAQSTNESAQLLGQLRFENQPEVELPASYSPESVAQLASDATELTHSIPGEVVDDFNSGTKIANIAFDVNLDARRTLDITDKKAATSLSWPLQGSDSASTLAQDSPDKVACLVDEKSLTAAEVSAEQRESVALARALDRGYALDFVLQLQAARGTNSAAQDIEKQRSDLNVQLRSLRSTLPENCSDLRLPAYQLPKNSLANLKSVVADAYRDYGQALLSAAGNVDGQAQQIVSTVAFEVWTGEQASQLSPLEVSGNK